MCVCVREREVPDNEKGRVLACTVDPVRSDALLNGDM